MAELDGKMFKSRYKKMGIPRARFQRTKEIATSLLQFRIRASQASFGLTYQDEFTINGVSWLMWLAVSLWSYPGTTDFLLLKETKGEAS